MNVGALGGTKLLRNKGLPQSAQSFTSKRLTTIDCERIHGTISTRAMFVNAAGSHHRWAAAQTMMMARNKHERQVRQCRIILKKAFKKLKRLLKFEKGCHKALSTVGSSVEGHDVPFRNAA
jgi:hypothetical protein